jgi:hypothetical protein
MQAARFAASELEAGNVQPLDSWIEPARMNGTGYRW